MITTTEGERKHTPLPLTFQDEPDGQEDAVIEYQGCPFITVRGSNDMSCLEEDEVDEVTEECKKRAHLVLTAVNSYYSLQEDNQKLRTALTDLVWALRNESDGEGKMPRRSVQLIMKLRAAESTLRNLSLLEESKPLNS